MSLYETLSIAITGGGLAAVAVQVGIGVKQARDENRRRRREATMEAYTNTVERRQDLIDRLPDDRDSEGTRQLAHNMVTGEAPDNEREAAVHYLALWENLATAVNTDVFDLEMMDRLAGAKIIGLAEDWHEYIVHAREVSDTPMLFKELEILAAAIRHRRAVKGQ